MIDRVHFLLGIAVGLLIASLIVEQMMPCDMPTYVFAPRPRNDDPIDP